jgi:hypothetical protein
MLIFFWGVMKKRIIIIMLSVYCILFTPVYASNIVLIFEAANVAKSVAEFTGLIESLESKVDKLIQSELTAGLRNLEQAMYSTNQQVSLLQEARNCFNRAAGLEKGYRQGVAYLGLAVCHYHLKDTANYQKTLEDLLTVNAEMNTALTVLTVADEVDEVTSPMLGLFGLVKLAKDIISDEGKDKYKEKILKLRLSSSENRSLASLQLLVSDYTNKPIQWASKSNITNSDIISYLNK